jgi:glycosyltransferase involved in cell wall biosynthesis
MKIKLSIVGIEGLPNRYGGFETLASYLVSHLDKKFDITVYCSSLDLSTKNINYYNANLKYIPLSSHGWQGVLYDIVSLRDSFRISDIVLFLGFGAGLYFPFISRKNRSKIILNFGGLDWQRTKWNLFTKKIIQQFESLMVRNVDWIIADNKKIEEYVLRTYHKKSIGISYGGDQAFQIDASNDLIKQYPFLKSVYACAVCRIQPDNNIEMILSAFSKIDYPLVVIGNWGNSNFGLNCRKKYAAFKHIHLLDAIYDPEKLNMFRSNCSIYIHGHSAGGTNPSLVEAMHLGLNILAFKSGYNELTTGHLANYFKTVEELLEMVLNFRNEHNNMGNKKMQLMAKQYYTWERIAASYEKLFLNVYQFNNGAKN